LRRRGAGCSDESPDSLSDGPGIGAAPSIGRGAPDFRPIRALSALACAVSAASRFFVSTISRSIPPSAQPISSADRINTSFPGGGFLRGRPLAIESSPP